MDRIDKALKTLVPRQKGEDPFASVSRFGGSFAHSLPLSRKNEAPCSGKMRRSPCPNCDKLLDGWTNALGKGAPEPGDFTTCMYCLTPLIFTGKLKLRLLTPAESRLFEKHEAGDRLNRLIREDRRRERSEFELTRIDIFK